MNDGWIDFWLSAKSTDAALSEAIKISEEAVSVHRYLP
jgi:hypothetical protein